MNPLTAALLRGRRLLFIQEERHIAQGLREDLASAAVEIVGPARTLGQVRALIADERRIDAAIFDLLFSEEDAIAAADDLLARGIPFVFAMDESDLASPRRHPGFVLCRKPIFLDEIASTLFGKPPPRGSA